MSRNGLAVAMLLLTCAGGCAGMGGKKPDAAKSTGLITLTELDQLNKAFADRFALLVATACDEIEENNPSLFERRKAHELKLYCATSVFDIASNADPYTSLLDLTLSVTLVSQVWIDEDRAEEMFGPERARVLISELRRARLEVWGVAARALKPEELEALDYLIWDWRRNNPAVEHVEFVRFNDFSAGRGKSQLADVKSGGGMLASVDEAKKAVDEARLFGERAFYLAKLRALTLSWQVEALKNELIATPELNRALENLDSASTSVDRLAKSIDRLPGDVAAERKAILTAFDEREKVLNSTIGNIRGATADIQKLLASVKEIVSESEKLAIALRSTSESLTGTIRAADTAAGHFMEPSNGDATTRPSSRAASGTGAGNPGVRGTPTTEPASAAFDIKEYTQAATELAHAAREMRLMVESTQELVASDAWTRRLEELNIAADGRVRLATSQSQMLVNDIFRRVYIVVGVIFLLIVVLRIISSWLRRAHRARAGDSSPAGVGKRTMAAWLVGLLCVGTAAAQGASPASGPATRPALRPAPTTVHAAPVQADASLPDYLAPSGVIGGTINSVGSPIVSNLMSRWADAFHEIHPGVTIKISGGGSDTATAPLVESAAGLAPMSRPMNDAERATFQKKFGYEPTEIQIAVDAMAIFVEKTNPIAERGLTLEQLDGIFSDERKRGGPPIRTWGDLGLDGEWANRPVTLYGYKQERSPSVMLRQTVLQGAALSASIHALPTSSSVVQAVGADPSGVAYGSIFFRTRRTRPLSIRGADGVLYAPSLDDCQTGKYPLARHFYVYVNKPPNKPLDPLVHEFLRFVLSRQGQQLAADGGNYPLTPKIVEAQMRLVGK